MPVENLYPKDVTIKLEPRDAPSLFDAIGKSVTAFGRVLAALPEHARPEMVQVVVVTDGDENSSREFNLDAVRALVTNQDAVFSGKRLGFDAGSSMTFAVAPQAVTNMNASVGRYIKDVRGKRKRMFDADERLSSMSIDQDQDAPRVPGSEDASPAHARRFREASSPSCSARAWPQSPVACYGARCWGASAVPFPGAGSFTAGPT